MKKIKLVIFDLDGTLIDSQQNIIFNVQKLREFLGEKKLCENYIKKSIGKGAHYLFDRVTTDIKLENKKQTQKKFFSLYKKNSTKFVKLFSGVIEILEFCKKKQVHTAILTNKLQFLLDDILHYFNLKNTFSIALGPPSIIEKPNPDGIFQICKKTDITPEETLMVGDSNIDILVANNANTKSCFIKDKIGTLTTANADYIINDIKELLLILKKRF